MKITSILIALLAMFTTASYSQDMTAEVVYQIRRQYSGSFDIDSAFTNRIEMNNYITNSPRYYAGQIISLAEQPDEIELWVGDENRNVKRINVDIVWGDIGGTLADQDDLTNTVNLASTAWQNPADATNWGWSSDGTQITLTNYSGPSAVVIPDMLDGLPVTTLGKQVFSGDAITSVIENGKNITSIGEIAFVNCNLLTSVVLHHVTSVGVGAFASCHQLSVLELPSVTQIGSNAFNSCHAITNMTFSASVAPNDNPSIFNNRINPDPVKVYVTNPTATGWGSTWSGMPVTRLGVTADEADIKGTITAYTYSLNSNRTAIADTIEIPTNAAIYDVYYTVGKNVTYSFGDGTGDLTIRLHGPGTNYFSDVSMYWASGYTNRAVTYENASGGILIWIGDEAATGKARILVDFIGDGINLISTYEEEE